MGDKRGIRKITTNTNAKKALHVEVFNNFEELEAIQQEWDNFVESVGSEIFLTYDWCRIWWKYYGKNRQLKVFIFRSDNKLVGIIPLFFEKIWLGPIYMRVLKIVGSDFTLAQFSLPIQNRYTKGIIEKLFESVYSEYNLDIIHLGPIAGLYEHYDLLKNACRESCSDYQVVLSINKNVQTYFKLSGSWEGYLAGLPRKDRTKIRRHYRLAYKTTGEKPDSIITNCAERTNFEQMFSDFVQKHQEHWQKLGRLGHFGDWHYAHEFHHELARVQLEQNRLRLMQITLGNCCFGYKYGYKCGDNFCDFLDTRLDCKELSNVSLGRILYSEMIKASIREKTKYIDSMCGKYKHKLEIGGELLPLRNLYVINKRLCSVIRILLFRVLAHALDFSYFRIWFLKIAPRLPIKSRPLWKLWIRTCAFA